MDKDKEVGPEEVILMRDVEVFLEEAEAIEDMAEAEVETVEEVETEEEVVIIGEVVEVETEEVTLEVVVVMELVDLELLLKKELDHFHLN